MGAFRILRGRPQSAATTLAALSLSPSAATVNIAYGGTISGATAGSTITATSSDGTTLTVTGSGTTRSLSGTFSAAGSPTITLTETLAGATNSPRSTPVSFTVSNSTIVNIANATELNNALSSGVGSIGGKTLLLAANTDFGTGQIYGKDFSSNPIAIVGQTGSVFQWMEIAGSKGITFKTFNVYGTYSTLYAVAIDSGCNGLTFQGVTVNASAATEGSPVDGAGWFITDDSTNISIIGQRDITKPDIWGRGIGVKVVNASYVTLKDLTLSNNGDDNTLLTGLTDSLIDGLYAQNNYLTAGGSGHPDFIQMAASGTGVRCARVTIQNCGTQRGSSSGLGSQGYFFEDCDNITCQNNWWYDGNSNGCSNARCATVTVNNVYLQNMQAPTDAQSTIITRGGSSNVTIENCYSGGVATASGEGPYPGYTESNNTTLAAVVAGNYTALDAWLAANPSVRGRT